MNDSENKMGFSQEPDKITVPLFSAGGSGSAERNLLVCLKQPLKNAGSADYLFFQLTLKKFFAIFESTISD